MNWCNGVALILTATLWVSTIVTVRDNEIAELSEKLTTCETLLLYNTPKEVSGGMPTHSLSYSF